jgi:hypothetical protein
VNGIEKKIEQTFPYENSLKIDGRWQTKIWMTRSLSKLTNIGTDLWHTVIETEKEEEYFSTECKNVVFVSTNQQLIFYAFIVVC